MTPEAKARELIEKYEESIYLLIPNIKDDLAKQCAIICVDEILNIEGNYLIERTYWQQVKQSIQST